MGRKRKAHTCRVVGGDDIDVPHDIVESILSRLPVKSLLRFKGVCKQWSATISDPIFALQRRSNSSNTSDNFIHRKELREFRRISLENGEFRELPALVEEPHPVLECHKVLCSCDGIFLLRRSATTCTDYVVWNPSTRTCREVCFPYQSIAKSYPCLNFGICYDALVRDYKVVIGDDKQYAVYYCSTDSWSEVREIITADRDNVVKVEARYYGKGIYFRGSIYWISRSWTLKEEGLEMSLSHDSHLYLDKFELLCFDGRDGKLKYSQNLNCASRDFVAHLTCSREGLYFFPVYCSLSENLVLMKKVGFEEPWMKIEVKLPFPCRHLEPMNSTQQNKIILQGRDHDLKTYHLLYDDDDTEKCVTQIRNPGFILNSRLFPIPENLVLL